MVYRIDIQHFLVHAIDYFTYEELIHIHYIIISAKLTNGGICKNVCKLNTLYPTPEIIDAYVSYDDKDMLNKMYRDMLNTKGDKIKEADIVVPIYNDIINPLIKHYDLMLICDKSENAYMDILCDILKECYSIEVIDLNKLFIDGEIGPIKIDRKKIWNKAVDIRLYTAKIKSSALETTEDGRLELLRSMSKKEKISKLKELGIKIKKGSNRELNDLLKDSWVYEDD